MSPSASSYGSKADSVDQLRAFIITQDEPFYIPKVVRHVLEYQGDEYIVAGGTVLRPHRKNKTIKDWFQERAQIYTSAELLLVGVAFAWCKSYERAASADRRGRYSVRHLLQQWDVPQIETSDVNDSSYVDRLRALEIDVVLSISPPQVFKKELLNVPTRYSLNAHGTLLPRHRGVFGSWWALYYGDREAGSTIHTMEARLDAGENLFQQAFPVRPDDTQYSVAYKTKRLLAKGLVEVLGKVSREAVETLPKEYEESYHRAPTREEGRAFHEKGLRIVRLRDLRYMLASNFTGPCKKN